MYNEEYIDGTTPIRDSSGLIPNHISNKGELDEWEAANIIKATRKYLTGKNSFRADIEWLKKIHKDMFDETWEWAGKFRDSNVGIGIDWQNIREQAKALIDDVKYWEKEKNDLSILEQSIRLHHRLVKIHPFQNGNGRHARLVADSFLLSHDQKLPTWPNFKLIKENNLRNKYISALQAADSGNYKLLEKFTKDLL
jgi:Fic-DOC domain mobile mystery protein B